jgi:protein-S-isoprenylcysteine O-methyltransferase Ste14
MTSAADNPGVITWPPLIAIGALVLGLVLDRIAPLGVIVRLGPVARIIVGVALFALGAWIAMRAKGAFERAGTNVEPWKPSLALATTGIYAKSRNPMYLGTAIMALGVAVGVASDWTILLLIPAAFVLHFGVVRREERYLEAKFGEDYRRYCASVPRYGWPI